uniref:Glycylpeptide N-tetradecanoyltransferase n=1 Tax=Junco hyemalis TaxID=40217 RepID=A0A8C5IQA7_JUNHY
MGSPAAQGTVPTVPTAQHTCVGAVPFWGLPGISVHRIFPFLDTCSQQEPAFSLESLRNQKMLSQKKNPKAPMMFLLFLRGLSPANDSGAKKKKKKPKRKKEKGGGDQADQAQDQPVKVSTPSHNPSPIPNPSTEIQKAIELFSVGQGPAKTMEEASKRSYQFWDTQPVPKLGMCTFQGVQRDKESLQTPHLMFPAFLYPLIPVLELYTLLNENYVEDDDNMFRFDYSPEFLLWALRPPGWLPQWHCGVRVVSSKKLVGFISAIPATIHIYDTEKKMVEINFLCVHKKLRSKRVAPVLIREITRRVHLEGIFQAVYTAGVVLPKPVGTCRYWHRSLNPRKLIEVKFSHLSRNMTMQRTTKLYRLPETPKTPGLRPMEHKDIPAVHKLLTEYLKQFHLTPVMSREEVEHWFVPQENIIDTFVVEVRAAAPWEGCSPGSTTRVRRGIVG